MVLICRPGRSTAPSRKTRSSPSCSKKRTGAPVAELGEIIGEAKLVATFDIVVSIAETSEFVAVLVSTVISFLTVIRRCISRTDARAIASTAKNRQSSKMLMRKRNIIRKTMVNSTIVAPRSLEPSALRLKREPPTGWIISPSHRSIFTLYVATSYAFKPAQ